VSSGGHSTEHEREAPEPSVSQKSVTVTAPPVSVSIPLIQENPGTVDNVMKPLVQEDNLPAPSVEMDIDLSNHMLANLAQGQQVNKSAEETATKTKTVDGNVLGVVVPHSEGKEVSPVKTEPIKQEVVIKQEPGSPTPNIPLHDTGVVICIDSSDEEDAGSKVMAPETTVTGLVKNENPQDAFPFLPSIKSEPNELDSHTSDDLWAEMVSRSDVFTCHCGKMFLNRRLYETHASSHGTQPGVIACNPCGTVFSSWFQLEMHLIDVHQAP
jgi:hypothetical protein